MSGVMIKMGIYGILRALTFLGTRPVTAGNAPVVDAVAVQGLKGGAAPRGVDDGPLFGRV